MKRNKPLFVWAFSKSRHGGEDKNQNIFYKAENIRLWSAMARYDSSNGTSFASQFDVSAPESSTKSMQEVEADYLQHRAQRDPIEDATVSPSGSERAQGRNHDRAG